MAGKDASFAVTVHKVEAAVLPPLDDDLALKLGIKEGGVEKLRQQVNDVMQNELDNVLRNRVKTNVLDKITGSQSY